MIAMANEATHSGSEMITLVIESHSPHETKSWGRRLASILEGGELLGLIGDLGAGKTVFIKGLAMDLGLREYLFSEGIAAVEWFERLREEPEMDYLSVRISYAGANLRRIEFSASGEHHAEIISKLQRSFA